MHESKLLKLLKENFGYDSFRLEQLGIINSILEGKDTLGIMPTGGGKSICYQLPALCLPGITLVVSPLIALMHDQVSGLKEQGIEAVFLNSSLDAKAAQEARAKLLNGHAKIVYASPEGILGASLGEFLSQLEISLIAIDEAHCVSQWGHEFRKDYIRLGELKDKFPGVPLLALTATADAKTRDDIARQLRLENPRIFVCSFDRPNIRYAIDERGEELKQLVEFIQTQHPQDTGIVYCLSRDKVERVAEALRAKKIPAVPYHAGLDQETRQRHQELFNTEERIIVVATIAFGMGIDRPDVRFVAHLDLPKSIEGYYQETGRAGRDGKPSSAWMVYGLQDVVKLSQMLENTDADESYKLVARFKLDRMLALCETAQCRRVQLLRYFGEELPRACGNCDTCLAPPVMWDATVDAQKVMSAIYRTGQTFGAGHVIDVLRGSQSAKVLERQHQGLSVFGIGKDRPKEHWNSILRQLLNLGYITIKNWEYRSLALTPQSRGVLTDGQRLLLRQQVTAVSKTKVRSGQEQRDEQAHGRTDLFDELKALRSRIAKTKGIPPYVVFSDKSLHDMCALLPRDDDEFLLVHGVGESKLLNYGREFLTVIGTHR